VLKRGSKDNMTAMIVEMKDGQDYDRDSEDFIPGEFHENANDTWVATYKKACERHGITLDEAKKLWAKIKQETGIESVGADAPPVATGPFLRNNKRGLGGGLSNSSPNLVANVKLPHFESTPVIPSSSSISTPKSASPSTSTSLSSSGIETAHNSKSAPSFHETKSQLQSEPKTRPDPRAKADPKKLAHIRAYSSTGLVKKDKLSRSSKERSSSSSEKRSKTKISTAKKDQDKDKDKDKDKSSELKSSKSKKDKKK